MVLELLEVLEEVCGGLGGELFGGVVSGSEGDGVDFSVVSGVDIVSHVAEEGGAGGLELVVGEDVLDVLPFVDDTCVGVFEVLEEIELFSLFQEEILVHR